MVVDAVSEPPGVKDLPQTEFGLGVLASVGLHVSAAARVEGPRLGHANEVTDPVASLAPRSVVVGLMC